MSRIVLPFQNLNNRCSPTSLSNASLFDAVKGSGDFIFFSSHHLTVGDVLNHFTYKAKFSRRNEQNVSSLWRQIYRFLFRSSDLFTCFCVTALNVKIVTLSQP